MKTQILQDVKDFIRNPFEFSYPKILIMQDCSPMCAKCAKENFKLIAGAVFSSDRRDSWMPGGVDVFWEGSPMQCGNCSAEMQSTYGDPESESEE